MANLQELLFGPPAEPGSNDVETSIFLANLRAANQNKASNLPSGSVELPAYSNEMESPSIEGLLKFNYADPDATGVAHDEIDSILAGNRAAHQQRQYDIHGTIGPTPYHETDEFKQEAFDIAAGLAFPGAAIGRTTKAAITGGQGIINNMPKKLVDEALELGGFEGLASQVNWNNKLNSARLLMEKALSKWGVDDRSRKLMDPVSEILRTSKYKQN